MEKNYIYTVLFSLVLSAFTVSCLEPDDEVTMEIFDRLFSPTNVEAVIQKRTNVRFKWTAVTSATSYTIELYENQDMTSEGTPKTYGGITDNTYTVEELSDEAQYTARIRALNEEINKSKWSAVSFITEAEDIFNSVEGENIEAHAATPTWDTIDATATKIVLSVDGEADMTYTLKGTDIASKEAYIDGLKEGTSYTTKLCNVNKLRGTVTFRTAISSQGRTPVYESDDLATVLEGAADDANVVFVSGSFVLGDYALDGSVIINGYDKANMPTIYGHLQAEAGTSSIEINNVIFRGDTPGAEELVSNFIELQSRANISTLTVSGCGIRNYENQILYCNVTVILGTALFENCWVDNTIGSGGDGFDLRVSTTLGALTIQNSAFNNGVRTFLRYNTISATISITDCIFYRVYSYDGGSNSNRLFLMGKVSTPTGKSAVGKCVFSQIGVGTSGYWAGKGKMKTQASYPKNYYHSSVNLWDATNGLYTDPSTCNATEIGPKSINPESEDFTVGAEDIKDSKASDPRRVKEQIR